MSSAFKAHKPAAAKTKATGPVTPHAAPVTKKKLDEAAERLAAEQRAKSHGEAALKEAAARKAEEAQRQKEIGGPEGPEPTRYGDWERKGIAYDF